MSMAKTRRSASATANVEVPKQHTRATCNSRKPSPQPPFSSPTTAKRCLRSMSTSSAQKLQISSGESVFLEDWWLIKANGKDLAVGGFASKLGQGVRGYSSFVISKRHCATTLEAADGTMVMINGLLNMLRSHQNGFASKVCYQFLHGFPYNWEEYADLGASKRTCAFAESIFSDKSGNNLSPSLNDLPARAVRDCLLSTLGHSDYDMLMKNIYNDAFQSSMSGTFENSRAPMDSNPERKRSVKNKKSGASEIPVTQNRNVGVRTRSMSKMRRTRSAAKRL